MNDETKVAEVAGEVKESKRADIVRGVIPHTLVYMIRFQEAGQKEAEVAKKYGTTSGKVADIVKGRNFAYIDESFKPTQEDLDKAVKWLRSVPGYDEVGTDAVVTAVSKLAVAGDADVAALQAKRAATRKSGPKAEGAEGGAKAPSKPRAAKAPKADAGGKTASVDELLS